jgi:hypothetical protein
MWQQWLNVVVGLWIILSGYLSFSPESTVVNLTISGLVVAGLALWGALEHNAMTSGEQTRRHV